MAETPAADSADPRVGLSGRPGRLGRRWSALPARWRFAVGVTAVCTAVLLAAWAWVATGPRAISVRAYDWTVSCDVTGRGEYSAETVLAVYDIETVAKREGPRVNRAFAGRRVYMDVRTGPATVGLAPGSYRVAGTVVGIDIAHATVRLTDCVFQPQ